MQENPTFCVLINIKLITFARIQRYPITKHAAELF